MSAGVAVPFFTLWLGETFRSSALVFRILIVASLFAMSQYVTNAVLTGLRRTRELMVSEVIGAVVNLGLSILLVHAGYGLAGVAIGTLVPMVARNVWLAIHGARMVGAPILPYVTRIYLPAARRSCSPHCPSPCSRAPVCRGAGWDSWPPGSEASSCSPPSPTVSCSIPRIAGGSAPCRSDSRSRDI